MFAGFSAFMLSKMGIYFSLHTTEERLSISSVERMWKYLLELLKR